MRILLDTDICIYAINRRRPEALSRIRGYPLGEVGISAMTYAELRLGVENGGGVDENMDRLERFLSPLEIVRSMPRQRGVSGGCVASSSVPVARSVRTIS